MAGGWRLSAVGGALGARWGVGILPAERIGPYVPWHLLPWIFPVLRRMCFRRWSPWEQQREPAHQLADDQFMAAPTRVVEPTQQVREMTTGVHMALEGRV